MLQERFKEWTDIDVAMFYVAEELGLIEGVGNTFSVYKSLIWSNNSFAKKLHEIVMALVDMGALETDGQRVRWVEGFKPKDVEA